MKKLSRIFLVSSLLAITANLSAEIEGSIETKFSYYHPHSGTLREIYSDRVLYGLEGSLLIYKDLFIYSGINFLPASGHSIPARNKIHLLLIPIEFGLEYFIPLIDPYLDLYFGAAITPFYVHVKDDSPFVVRKRTKWDIGGSFKSGLVIFPGTTNFFLDIFVDYYLLKTKFDDTDRTVGRKTNFSGLSIGGGLGYAF